MLLVVTGVGAVIHIYSIGYMAHEGGYYRFFAFLNLFMFFMLVLVLASNYLVMFVGWEGVGLCSYLLIGFYFDKKFATDAGNKAFIVNRIGDFGFSLAMFYMVKNFGSLDFATVFKQAPGAPEATLTIIGLLLMLGACGKSAQLPLYVWLPDAMAGPTPVSALIHAATMVTAGVYMTARSWAIYTHAPAAMNAIAIIGVATAFFAATIGLAQNDIKKVFAYSTVSQLGYMFLGVGCGAFSAGIYHLVTHAFFKALLFLGAGSVIHALSGEQDLRHMGGLRKKIPWTYVTMMCAAVAIAGVPPFSGFFSKDAILVAAHQHAPWMYWLGTLTAGMTAFYVFRAIFLAFFGEYRGDKHAHESPPVMLIPLAILALLSLAGGFLFKVPQFLAPIFPALEAPENPALVAISVAAGLMGIALAWLMYVARPGMADSFAASVKGLYTLVYNKYFVDEIYAAAVVNPVVGRLARGALERRGREADRWRGERSWRARPQHRQPAAADTIRQHPQLRHVGAVRLGAADRGDGDRGRPPMNLPTLILALPLAGFLVALLVPRSSPQGSRDLGHRHFAGDVRGIAGLAGGIRPRRAAASNSPWTCRGSPRPTFTTTWRPTA